MTVAAFDTHAAVTALRKAGFDEPQAEAAVEMVRDALAEGFATKTDIDGVKAEITAFKAEIKAEIRALEVKIDAVEVKIDAAEVKIDAVFAAVKAVFAAVKWVAGITVALVIAIAARLFGAI